MPKKDKRKVTEKKKSSRKEDSVNTSLLNAITPVSINVERNGGGIGEYHYKAYVITRYNSTPDIGWLADFTSIPNVFCTCTFRPCDRSVLLDTINKNISKYKSRLRSVRDELEISRLEQMIDDSSQLIRDIDQKGSAIVQTAFIMLATGQTYEEMQEVAREIETTAAVAGCKVTVLSWGQEEALKSILPYYPINDYVQQVGGKLIPMRTVQGGFPQAASQFRDPDGFVVGREHRSRKSCLLDPWLRGGDRSNGNMVYLGKPGQGKSTALKWVIANLYASGTRIICIDPEREYREMCTEFGGDWLDCAGDSRSRINPLQIMAIPSEQEEDDDRIESLSEQRDLSRHLKRLETFIRLYLSDLNDYEMAALKEVLIALYKRWGIDFDTDVSGFGPEDFPVFSDLYTLLEEYAEKGRRVENRKYYANLAMLFRDIATGSDAELWNGPTTLASESDFVVLDTNLLGDSAENIRRAQYFNVLSWTWEQMSRDRKEKVFLVCDETYLMIDPQVPQSLSFLRNVSKRARKYECGLGIVSHAVSDFLSPEIRMYGQPLLDNPTYKFMFGSDGQNLKDLAGLYNLTETEKKTLEKQMQGVALMEIGANKFVLDVVIPDWFFGMMGSAGGRGGDKVKTGV